MCSRCSGLFSQMSLPPSSVIETACAGSTAPLRLLSACASRMTAREKVSEAGERGRPRRRRTLAEPLAVAPDQESMAKQREGTVRLVQVRAGVGAESVRAMKVEGVQDEHEEQGGENGRERPVEVQFDRKRQVVMHGGTWATCEARVGSE